MHGGYDLIQDIGLRMLVVLPVGVGSEKIDLHRDAFGAGLKLAHHIYHIVAKTAAFNQPSLQIPPEQRKIYLLFAEIQPIGPFLTCKAAEFLNGKIPHGIHIDIERPLDAASPTPLHVFIIMESSRE